ncbi:MAG TPA: type II secretion system F family protein [Pseudonocardiaceae bacterium]|jgi:pilus assembly protein TadC
MTAAPGQAAAVLLLAVAVLVLPCRTTLARRRLAGTVARTRNERGSGWPAALLPALCGLAVGLLLAVVVGGGAGVAIGGLVGISAAVLARRWSRGPLADQHTEPLRLAGAWDLLAACLRAGLPVATATCLVAEQLPGQDGGVLRRVAELLAGGADAAEAWQPALANPSTAALARAARQTARSGAAMASAVSELASQVRAGAADLAEERAQRAGVLIVGPLGLCFLPAFFCLGVLPVVIGLAEQLIEHW